MEKKDHVLTCKQVKSLIIKERNPYKIRGGDDTWIDILHKKRNKEKEWRR